jgi:hypothetical protein
VPPPQLITAGDNPDRMNSEASFAALRGVSLIEASSGKTPQTTPQPRTRSAHSVSRAEDIPALICQLHDRWLREGPGWTTVSDSPRKRFLGEQCIQPGRLEQVLPWSQR